MPALLDSLVDLMHRLDAWAQRRRSRRVLGALRSAGAGMEIHPSVRIDGAPRVSIGNHVYVGPGCILEGQGGLEIHDHAIFGPEVAILTVMHNFRDADMVPYDRIDWLKPVVIERCVWVGMRALIMPGVRVGEGSVIGAGAVVTKSCPPGSILGGNPARIIGQRDMDRYRELAAQGRFYLLLKQQQGLTKLEKPAPADPSDATAPQAAVLPPDRRDQTV